MFSVLKSVLSTHDQVQETVFGAGEEGWGREQCPPAAEGTRPQSSLQGSEEHSDCGENTSGRIFSFGLVKSALNLAAVQLQRHQAILSFQ